MATPSDKSKKVESFLDSLSENLFGKSRTEAITKGECVTCPRTDLVFDDIAESREYTISGMCKDCQDEVFN
jgi:hypothetical protein